LILLPKYISSDTAREKVLAAMNQRYAVVREGGRTIVIEEAFDHAMKRGCIHRSTFYDIRACYQHCKMTDYDGKATSVGNWWLNHLRRRQYDQVVFSPDATDVPKSSYNLWRGFAVAPQVGDWSLFLDHILENICCGDSDLLIYLLAWMTQGIQHPEVKPEVAIVLRSEERGTGKSFFARYYRKLFGQHGIELSNSQHLTGRFNEHLEDCCVLVINEALWAGSQTGEAVLKTLITEDTLAIEPKGFSVRFARNYLRVIMTSNAEWVVPAGFDERRFLMLDVGTAHKQDLPYFKAIADQMDNGGLAAMLYDFQRWDFSGIELRCAPKTAALMKQKILSLEPRERWLFDKLHEGRLLTDDIGWCPEVDKSVLTANFAESLKRNRGRDVRSSQTELGAFLARVFGPKLLERRPTVGDSRVRRWLFPPLAECRALFEARLGARYDWPADDGIPGTRPEILVRLPV
jgi:hypothetical protein